MKYRKFGKFNWEVSALGFDAGALPAPGSGDNVEMIRTAIDLGVNYLDLGMPEDGSREQSIDLIRWALEDGYRARVRIAAHVPVTRLICDADLDTWLDRYFHDLREDRIDFLILDGINRDTWTQVRGGGVLDRIEAARNAGSVEGLGFSFRDHQHYLRQVLEDFDGWNLCQFQYSYMDVDHLPGLGGIRQARAGGLAVVVSEPLRGGRLAQEPPVEVASVWAGAGTARTLAEWGLHWVWNHPEVSTLICAMGTLDQLREYSSLAARVDAGSLSIQEQVLIGRVRDAYRKLKPIPCAACRVCMPCPQDIDVPRILELYNEAIMYDDLEAARTLYEKEQHRLEDCNECGACVDACGRMIAILDWLEEARSLLENNKGVSVD